VADNIDISWAVEEIKDRTAEIGLYRAYYDGNHRKPFATAKWNEQFSSMFSKFRDNLCPAVVDAKADRIQLTGIQGPKPDDAVSAAINAIWTRENLEYRHGEITKNALKDGDAFVIVWPDTINQARWYIQRGDRVAVKYRSEPQGELECAAKLFPITEYKEKPEDKVRWRLNLYYDDRVERYITQDEIAGGDVPKQLAKWDEFEPDRPEEDDDEAQPGEGSIIINPYGRVPVFPFPNNADLGAYGRSELKDVIPLQDALNKSVSNMLVAGEFVSWPQRFLIGVDVDVDEEGNPTGREQKAALDRILAIANPNAKAGEFSAADLTNFIKEQDSYRAEMARISRTPLHHLLMTGDFPSGEALGAAERPLASQVADRIAAQKPAYQRAMSFSLKIENVDHDMATLNPIFKDTEWHSTETQVAEWTAKKDLGIPDEQIWEEMGYDKEQIKRFKEAKEERTREMQSAFNAGTPDTINPEAEDDAPGGDGGRFLATTTALRA
jgi:Phage portal protein, SPP1 Gp6-like